jgi:CHAT domain-containing protein/tetratricopeptide (TPR) repeat protein
VAQGARSRRGLVVWAAALLAATVASGQPSDVVARQLRLHALQARALSLLDGGSFDEALALYTRIAGEAHALPRFPAAGPASWERLYNRNVNDLEASALEGIGTSLVRMGEAEKALPHYEKSLAVHPEGSTPMWAALVRNRLGVARHRMLDQEGALREYRRALASAKDAAALLTEKLRSGSVGETERVQHANDAITLRQVYLNASSVLVSLGRFEEALEAYRQKELLALQEALRDPLLLARLGSLGPIVAGTSTLVDAFLVNAEGACLSELAEETGLKEDYEKAIAVLTRGLEAARASRDSEVLLVAALGNLGAAYQGLGRTREAVAAYEEAIREARRQGATEPRSELAVWNNLADASLEWGDLPRARSAIASAEAIGKAHPEPDMGWRLESLRGRLLEAEGLLEDAAEHFGRALDLVERERAALSIPKLKETFFRTRQSPYENLARVLVRLRRHEEALHVMEKARARSLADSLAGLDGAQPAAGARGRNAGRTYLEILAASEEYADVRGAEPLPPREIAALLDPQTALVAYLVGRKTAVAAVLRPDGTAVSVTLPVEGRALEQQVSAFARLVRGAGPVRGTSRADASALPAWRPASEALYQALVAPVQGHLAGATRLAVVPYGVLNYVPFAALARPGGALLVETHEIVVLPSATVLKHCRARSGRARESTVVFSLGSAEPRSGEVFRPLPWTVAEGRAIRDTAPGVRLVQEAEFTKESVRSLAPRYGVVHFATHGVLDGVDPLRSAVVTADEPLRVEDIFELRLRAGLVVLSACDTGLGRLVRGDEIVGLTRAFFHAGAPSVLATLWSVNDESTARFMAELYRGLRAPGATTSSALRRAQIELMKRYPNPFHWAPFALWGDWR